MTPYEIADTVLEKIKQNQCNDMCDWLCDLINCGHQDGFDLVDKGNFNFQHDYYQSGDFSIVVNFNGTNMGLDGYYSSYTDCRLSQFYPVKLEKVERYIRDDG